MGVAAHGADAAAGTVPPESLRVPPGELVEVRRPAGDASIASDYLKRILTANVYDVAVESPLEPAERLSERIGNNNKILLKREDMQPVFSFKLRGAYNCMAQLTDEQLKRGVICSSAGNHAQGVALAASRLGTDAIICMPLTTPAIKVNSVKRLGATVKLVGEAYDETQAYAAQRAIDEGRTFIPPFDNPAVIAGQGTVGLEILRQCSGRLDAIFVPIGGGGLAAGVAAYIKCLRPDIKVIGVEPAQANGMAQSLYRGEITTLSRVDAFADGVAVKKVGTETFRVCQQLLDGVVLVDTDLICAAIKDVFEDTRSILEPAGAVALAGCKAFVERQKWSDATCVAITSGANMNFDRLRVVSELADLGLRSEAVLATKIAESPGSFKHFCSLVGSDMNITEFKYRQANSVPDAAVLYSVSYRDPEELEALKARMEGEKLETFDLSEDNVTTMHLRHLVGGHAQVDEEALYQITFPERPGALMTFLDAVSPRWNITMFHYRNQGSRESKVLVGFETSAAEREELEAAFESIDFAYTFEGDNTAFNTFCR